MSTRTATADALALLDEAERNLQIARELVAMTFRTRRVGLDLGLRQFARIAKLDPSELSKIELGKPGHVTSTTIRRVSEALDAIEDEQAADARRIA